MATKKSGKKKAKKFVEQGVINIRATFNNTIITISDTGGNVSLISDADILLDHPARYLPIGTKR